MGTRSSSEIPNTAPFPACGRKTALCWEFLRFSATIRFAGFVAEMKREMWVWGCISFVKKPHDKLADYTKGVVCRLFMYGRQKTRCTAVVLLRYFYLLGGNCNERDTKK